MAIVVCMIIQRSERIEKLQSARNTLQKNAMVDKLSMG